MNLGFGSFFCREKLLNFHRCRKLRELYESEGDKHNAELASRGLRIVKDKD